MEVLFWTDWVPAGQDFPGRTAAKKAVVKPRAEQRIGSGEQESERMV
jgi:hypothetical protein